LKITILGSGTSTGVPTIGCHCEVCSSDDIKDKRLRSSIFIEYEDSAEEIKKNILIDIGPDFRQQVLRQNINHIDSILITHTHYDHIGGLDDIRPMSFFNKKLVKLFCSKQAYDQIKKNLPYIFNKENQHMNVSISKNDDKQKTQVLVGKIPKLEFHVLEREVNQDKTFKVFQLNQLNVQPIEMMHVENDDSMFSIGYIFNQKIAYITDFKYILAEYEKYLYDLDVIIMGTPLAVEHRSHVSFYEAIDLLKKFNPKKAYITHLAHKVSHNDLIDIFKNHAEPSYDGLSFKV